MTRQPTRAAWAAMGRVRLRRTLRRLASFSLVSATLALVDLRVSGFVILGLGLSAFGLGQGYRPLKSLCLCHCRLGGIGLCHCRRGGKDFVIVGLEVQCTRRRRLGGFFSVRGTHVNLLGAHLLGKRRGKSRVRVSGIIMCGLLPENLGHGVLRVVAVVRYGRRLCALRACRATAPLWVLGAPPVPTAREALGIGVTGAVQKDKRIHQTWGFGGFRPIETSELAANIDLNFN